MVASQRLYTSIFCLVFFLSISSELFTQSIGQIVNEAKISGIPIDTQIINLSTLLDTISQLGYQDTLGSVHYYIANRYARLDEIDSTIRHAEKSIEAFEKSSYRKYRFTTNYALIGNAYLRQGNDFKSLEAFKNLISLEVNDDRSYHAKGTAQYRIAEIYRLRGNYDSAIATLENVIQSDEFKYYRSYDKASIYRELSYAYSFFQETEKIRTAFKHIDFSNSFLDDIRRPDLVFETKVLNLQQRALLNLASKDTIRAAKYYDQAIELSLENAADPNYNYLTTIGQIGKAYILNHQSEYDKSLVLLNQLSDNIEFDNDSRSATSHSFLLLRKIESLMGIGLYQDALDITDSLIDLLTNGLGTTSINSIQNVFDKPSLIKCLMFRFDLFKKLERTQDIVPLLSKTDSLIDFHIQDLYFTSSISHLKSTLDPSQINVSDFYRDVLDFSFSTSDIDLFWHFSEKLNNLLILRNIRIQEHDLDTDQMFEVTKNIKDLEFQLSDLERQLYFDESITSDIKEQLNQQIIELNSIILSQYQERAAYFDNLDFNISSVEQAKASLDKDESLLKFAFGNQKLYGMHLASNNTEFKELSDIIPVKGDCITWHKLISKGVSDSESIQQLHELSDRLYGYLIDKWNDLSASISIVPDGELYYLNFDALKTPQGEYLIWSHSVQYLLSASFRQSTQSKDKKISRLSLFVPAYEQSELADLKHVDLRELEDIGGVSKYIQEAANTENFISALQHSDLIHYGGHAILEEKNNNLSHLVLQLDTSLSSNIITLGNLYALQTNAALVSLPACNTASGDVLIGEGISNLSRGFFYAGAKSILSSLWEANDKSTNYIMNQFYLHLRSGWRKGESLRLAKLDYLTHSSEYLTHPYYWAGLTLSGDNSSCIFKGKTKTLYWLLLILAMPLLYLFGRKIVRQKS